MLDAEHSVGFDGGLREVVSRVEFAANLQLQERELMKLSAAKLTAEAGVAVFKVALERWINEGRRDQLAHFIQESLDELKEMAAGG
jgi:hypothetical protein